MTADKVSVITRQSVRHDIAVDPDRIGGVNRHTLRTVEPAEQRLRKAIERLQDTSLLKLRCQMFLSVLAKDDELFSKVQERFDALKASKLSVKQRFLLEVAEPFARARHPAQRGRHRRPRNRFLHSKDPVLRSL